MSALIITRDTLRATGIKHLLDSLFNIKAQILSAADSCLQSLPQEIEQHEIIFVDEQNCLSHLDLFISQKNKTVILANNPVDNPYWHYIDCTDNEDHIVDAIAAIIKELRQSHSSQAGLSSRETDVLRLIAQGLTNKEIAETLNISINTVLSHRKNISAKLGIKSVSGLCIYAMMNGIIR